MRKLLLLGMLLWGSAGAAKLYTVTVKTSPFFTDNTFSSYPLSDAQRPKYERQEDGDMATFQLPAGKFNFTALEQTGLAQEYEGANLTVNIKGNTTVVIPVKPYPVMSKAGELAFDDLLLKLNAVKFYCSQATVSDLCAVVEGANVRTVRGQISSYKGFKQVKPWEAIQDQFLGRFQVEGKPYRLVLHQEGANTSLLFMMN